MEVKVEIRKIKNKTAILENKKYFLVRDRKNIQNITCTKNKLKKIKKFLKTFVIEGLKLLLIFGLITIMQDIINGNELYSTLIQKIKDIGIWKTFGTTETLNTYLILNILVSFAFYTFIHAITNRKKMALIITTSLLFLYETANYVVTSLRGTAITILDILSLKTALNVSKGLDIKFSRQYIIGTVIYLLILLLIVILYRKKEKRENKFRILTLAVSLITFVLIFNSETINSMPIWNINDIYNTYGTNLTLVRMLKDLNVKAPQNYSRADMENKLKKYNTDTEEYNKDVNIVVIMNESFADYTNNEYINITEDNIPFFHFLQESENVITGIMHSDAFGGKTANIEYEVLTQNTIAFLPEGAIVYQQYIKDNVKSIVSKMKSLDYATYAIHPWYSSGYNRPRVYNLMGFDTYKFKEDYDDLEYDISGYTTDKCAYSKIIEQFENKNDNEKIFSFNVTMQTHLPYTDTYEDKEIYSENHDVNTYLQRQNESDEALKTLIEYFNGYNEKVIILFFGDHQPYLSVSEIINDEENKYKVPYLIWSNYDIETKDYGDTSANFLQSILIETAHLPKDEYTNYMIELRKEIPVITANYYIGNNEVKYYLDDSTSPYYKKILEYKHMVYYQMFDNK